MLLLVVGKSCIQSRVSKITEGPHLARILGLEKTTLREIRVSPPKIPLTRT